SSRGDLRSFLVREERLERTFTRSERIEDGARALRRRRKSALRRATKRICERHERERSILRCEIPRNELIERRFRIDVLVRRGKRIGSRLCRALGRQENERARGSSAKRIGRLTRAPGFRIAREDRIGHRDERSTPARSFTLVHAEASEREDRHLAW